MRAKDTNTMHPWGLAQRKLINAGGLGYRCDQFLRSEIATRNVAQPAWMRQYNENHITSSGPLKRKYRCWSEMNFRIIVESWEQPLEINRINSIGSRTSHRVDQSLTIE